MKKLFTLLAVILTVATMAFQVACQKPSDPLVIKESDTLVVVKVADDVDMSLIDYVKSLEEYKDSFVIENGMIVEIDGVKNEADWSACWMIYTSDAENANTAWGEVEYQGEIYGSAILGAESLMVKKDCIYIFVYQSF